jgi:hypothetical protein
MKIYLMSHYLIFGRFAGSVIGKYMVSRVNLGNGGISKDWAKFGLR